MLAMYHLDPPADDWVPEGVHLETAERWMVDVMGLAESQAVTITAKLIAAGWACPMLGIRDDGTTIYTPVPVMDHQARPGVS